LGTLIYEMLTGWPPFYDKNIRKMCEQILKVRCGNDPGLSVFAGIQTFSRCVQSELTFPPTLTAGAEVRDLIRGLLDRNPATRLGSGPAGAEGGEVFAFGLGTLCVRA
jgi:serine/threonine protein kinase